MSDEQTVIIDGDVVWEAGQKTAEYTAPAGSLTDSEGAWMVRSLAERTGVESVVKCDDRQWRVNYPRMGQEK